MCYDCFFLLFVVIGDVGDFDFGVVLMVILVFYVVFMVMEFDDLDFVGMILGYDFGGD